MTKEVIVARGVIKGKLTRITKYVQELAAGEVSFDEHELRVRREELEKLADRFDVIQAQIEATESTAAIGTAETTDHEAERQALEERFYTTKAAINRLLDNSDKPPQNTHGETPNRTGKTNTQIRLPKLQLPQFSREIQEWAGFRNLFESAMDSSSVPPLQRLQYLKSSLKGEAASLISSLLLTEGNYNQAMYILTQSHITTDINVLIEHVRLVMADITV
ncbi:uncharacterized protein [Battus philenor]|uniref:uncharacterized protein n=1 Tax=Battus philenor TaxID=42288 RepID=UPI0035D0A680